MAIAAGVLVTTGLAVVPAGAATERQARIVRRAAPAVRPALAFTPAAADPRLAAVFARGGFDSSGLRFTPADTRHPYRAVTVAVRARTNRAEPPLRTATSTEPTVGLTPIAYNLGVAVGWRRFGISGDVRRVDMASQPGGREAADVTVTYAGNRVTGRVKAVADRPFAEIAPRIDNDRSYSLDLGGSYRVTRNLDVTAGLRYRTERDRLVRLDEDRRRSQAVYVGTAFRF